MDAASREIRSDATYVAFADADITSVTEDKLSRAPFAKRVAELIEGIPAGADSTVIGIIGPWGGGKTSILNLIRAELEQNNSMGVAQFTPWAVSDSASLMVEFFATLLNSHASLGKAKQKQKLTSLAQKLSPALGGFGAPGKAAAGLVEEFLDAGNWQKQFKELDDLISESGARILITVDDVDRLHGDEILTLIKTIRMLGRFHNVHYVLAYDHAALVDALKPSLGGNERRAAEYLEKIVQYPLDIPPAQEGQLRTMLDEGLESLFSDDPAAILSDGRGRFQLLYNTELKRFLTTARAVKRFVAQANHYFDLVSGHVDVSDFLILTFVRLQFPAIYSRLPQWRDDLTRHEEGIPREIADRNELTWEHRLTESGVNSVEERQSLLRVLKELFPAALGGFGSSAQARRVSNDKYFDRYFVFGLPEGDISDLQVREDFLAAALGNWDEQLFQGTFTSSSLSVRSLAVEKAEPLVAELDAESVPTLTRFVIWLMQQEHEASPEYMFGVLLADLLLKHPGFEDQNDWEQLFRQLPNIRTLRTALDRVYSLSRVFNETGGDDLPEPPAWRALRGAITSIGVSHLISLAAEGRRAWRDFMETYAVVNSHGDIDEARKLTTKALSQNQLELVSLAAFFVYPDMSRTGHEYRLLDLDVKRLLTLVEEKFVMEAALPPCPEAAAVEDRSKVSWDDRMNLAIYGLHRWRTENEA